MTIQSVMPTNLPPIDRSSPKVDQAQTGGLPSGVGSVAPSGGASFGEVMESAVASVNEAQKTAATKAGQMGAGKVPIDEAMITMEKADLSFRMMTQVRNKVVDAYREVMRMNF